MVDDKALAGVVYADYLLAFPQAGSVSVDVNGSLQCPAKEYLDALCEGFIGGVRTLVIQDNVTGTADSPGVATPAVPQFPGSASGIPVWLGITGWAGPSTPLLLQVTVDKLLTRFGQQALVQMNPPAGVGTGVGAVGAFNSLLASAFKSSTPALLQAAFASRAIFCRDFDVSQGPNPEVVRTIPAFVEAWATGLQTLTVTVSYVGSGASPVPPASTVGTGRFM